MMRKQRIISVVIVMTFVISMICASSVHLFADFDELYKGSFAKKEYWNVTYDNGKYTHYRLPGIVITQKDTVIIYGEARDQRTNEANGDMCEMDIYLRRSTDGGSTFCAPIYIAEGTGKGKTYNNPVMIVGDDGRIHLLFCCDVGRSGMFYTYSDDDGISWTEPENIQQQFSNYSYSMFAFGPGHGVCLDSGRLITSAWLYNGTYCVYPVYSDDNGKTWRIGSRVSSNLDETCIAQTSDGGVLFNSRQYSLPNEKMPYRVLSSSLNGINSWTSSKPNTTLVDPACCGGMTSVKLRGLPHTILFSNCASATKRTNLTVRSSFDDGLSWDKSIVIDKDLGGYSDIAVDRRGKVYVIYETFMGSRVNLATFSYYETFCAGDDVIKSKITDWTDVGSLLAEKNNVDIKEGNSGSLAVTVTDGDAPSVSINISNASKAVNVTELPVMALRVKSTGSERVSEYGAYVMCGRNSAPSSKLYANFSVLNDGKEHTVLVDMSDREAYKGNLLGIKFECYSIDSPAVIGNTLEITQVGFYASEEEALSVYPPIDVLSDEQTVPVTEDRTASQTDENKKGGCSSNIVLEPIVALMPLVYFVFKKRD